jgi:chemotaxis protein MotB
MAKITDESGEIMIPGKPSRPPPPPSLKPAGGKQRKFPFRLWAYALLMTAGTAAGGYYVWTYRGDKIRAEEQMNVANAAREKSDSAAKKNGDELTTCRNSLESISGNAKETDTKLSQTATAAAACQSALTAAEAAKKESDKRLASIADFQKKFSDMVGTGKLKVGGRRGNLILELPSEVLFPSGSADLSKSGELNVLQVGLILKEMPDRRFLVVGHTDSAPLNGSIYKDNWELSTARSLTVVRFLVQAGMKAENLIPAGEGEHDPISSNSTGEGRQRNRRIEIILLPAITELPPLPAGLEDAIKGGGKGK